MDARNFMCVIMCEFNREREIISIYIYKHRERVCVLGGARSTLVVRSYNRIGFDGT